jgi:hypothetical protein
MNNNKNSLKKFFLEIVNTLGLSENIYDSLKEKITSIDLDDDKQAELWVKYLPKLLTADKELKKVNDELKSLFNDQNNETHSAIKNNWGQLLVSIANLQGLILIRKVNKVNENPTLNTHSALIESLIEAFDNKLIAVNNILVDDLKMTKSDKSYTEPIT